MNDLRSKIRGMFLGVAIGDALGMPVEMWTTERMLSVHPHLSFRSNPEVLIDQYLKPINHKYFSNRDPGTWTDDTQLTLAVANGILESTDMDPENLMDAIAKAHIKSYEQLGDNGFGGTTRLAIQAMQKGKRWQEAAPTDFGTGYGNGVVMKIAPLAVLKQFSTAWGGVADRLATYLTLMTHKKRVAVSGTHAMLRALSYCLSSYGQERFNRLDFTGHAIKGALFGWALNVLPDEGDEDLGRNNLVGRIAELANWRSYTTERIIQDFGKGSVHVNDSLPFSLMFFVQNPFYIDTLYRTVGAGGDTDSTGSMVGALLGALHGEGFWPDHLVNGLDKNQMILDTADRLFEMCEAKSAR